MLKKLLSLAVVIVVSVAIAHGEKPTFDQLAVKADRFIQYKEWASAQAMLQLMVEEKPSDPALTGKAIAVAGLRNDSIEQLRLFKNAVSHRQPFEKVFSAVETESFALARCDVYEDFLLMIARHEQWLQRTIDGYLLKYYTFRCDGPGMVAYADRMLAGLPDDVTFLHDKARGLMLTGDFPAAMDVYRRIVEVAPDNVDALLSLAYYAESQGDKATALSYLNRAYAVMPTPYLKEKIAQCNNNG